MSVRAASCGASVPGRASKCADASSLRALAKPLRRVRCLDTRTMLRSRHASLLRQAAPIWGLQPLSRVTDATSSSGVDRTARIWDIHGIHDAQLSCGGRRHLTSSSPQPSGSKAESVVIYRGPWLQVFRLLVRAKVTQLVAAGAAAAPLVAWNTGHQLSGLETVGVGGLCVGASAASGALWYYSRRYVGQLALVGDRVCISTLDFWGRRSDMEVHRHDIKPPFPGLTPEQLGGAVKLQPMVPLEGVWAVIITGDGRQSCRRVLTHHAHPSSDWAAPVHCIPPPRPCAAQRRVDPPPDGASRMKTWRHCMLKLAPPPVPSPSPGSAS